MSYSGNQKVNNSKIRKKKWKMDPKVKDLRSFRDDGRKETI